MDNIECLKTLTENIIKKQDDSLESIKKLSRKTDMINSDISNLINSLQMVGNRQFAENRVQEEEPASEQQKSLIFRQQQQPDEIYTDRCSQASSGYKLSSILLKAIELIPPRPQQEPQKTKPIDRDRITDILMRYELYNKEEDETLSDSMN